MIYKNAVLVVLLSSGYVVAQGVSPSHQTHACQQHTVDIQQNCTHAYDDLVMCLDDESDELDKLEQAPNHWTTWMACKEALKALYALLMSKMRALYDSCLFRA